MQLYDPRLGTKTRKLKTWWFPRASEDLILEGVLNVWRETLRTCVDASMCTALRRLLEEMDIAHMRSLLCKVHCVVENFSRATSPANWRLEDVPTLKRRYSDMLSSAKTRNVKRTRTT